MVFAGATLLTLAGCGHVFVMNRVQTRDELLSRATHVLVGVIENQELESAWSYRASVPSDDGERKYWRILRRRIRVETVLFGSENRKTIDAYEVFWTGGTTGDWNSTADGERAVFLLRLEDGYYRMVQDWERSIFTVTTGSHGRMPLDDSHALWERIALMNFWIKGADGGTRITYPYFRLLDPGRALSTWRIVKLQRGLLRHPSAGVRVPACRELLLLGGWGQDECWEMLAGEERVRLHESGYLCCSTSEIASWRTRNEKRETAFWWKNYRDREDRRLLTAINSKRLRPEFCRLYEAEYPGDRDTGCPANLTPPATIVTEAGDVELRGAWPH